MDSSRTAPDPRVWPALWRRLRDPSIERGSSLPSAPQRSITDRRLPASASGRRCRPWTPSRCSRTTTRRSRRCSSGSRRRATTAFAEKREVVDRIIEELSIHAAIEEQLFYPVTRATVPDDRGRSPREPRGAPHRQVGAVRARRDGPAGRALRRQGDRAHRERAAPRRGGGGRSTSPRSATSSAAMRSNDLGDAMVSAKAVAPTHPHPRAPDTPPGNLVVGTAAGVVDRVTDTVSGIAQGGVTALGDLIATVLRRKKPRWPPPVPSRLVPQRPRCGRPLPTRRRPCSKRPRGPSPPPRVPPVPPAGAPAERLEQPSPAPRPPPLQPASRRSGRYLRPSGARPRPAALLARPPSAPRQPPSAPRQPPSAPRQLPSARRQPQRRRQAPALTEGVPELRFVTSSSQSANRRL